MSVETPGAMTPPTEGGGLLSLGVLGDMGCPEREWQQGLMLLAETLALHCRTRSAEEIAAFMMHEGSAQASKRHSSNTNANTAGFEEVLAVDAVPASAHSHGHDHGLMVQPCLQILQPPAQSSPTPSDFVNDFFAHSHQHHLQG